MSSFPPTSPPDVTKAGANSLPAELWLEIIPHIPYTATTLSNLRLTCSQLNSLVKAHEHSLVADIKAHQFSKASIQLFPSLQLTTYAGLSELHKRSVTLEELHSQWPTVLSHSAELHWLKGRWESVYTAGFMLLYRLQDAGTYEAKVELIGLLPATSLACLLFVLISSIKILRVVGPEPIHGEWRKSDVMVRSDIELAFEEVLLQHGPEFFIAVLGMGMSEEERRAWAVGLLTTEISTMGDRQAPYANGDSKPPTLISSLRRALASKAEAHMTKTVTKMWEILSGTAFDEFGHEMLAQLVKGEGIEVGCSRMVF